MLASNKRLQANSITAILCAGALFVSACSDGKLPDGTPVVPEPDDGSGSDTDLPRVSFESVSDTADESVASQSVTVVLSKASASAVTVQYDTIGEATGGGTDYTLAAGTVTFAAGETSKTLSLAIVDDALSEIDERVVVRLSTPNNAILGSVANYVYTIEDNDPLPTVEFDSATSSGSESASPALVTLSLSSVSGRDVTVDFTAAAGTATSGTDYTLAGGTITFLAGETSKSISIPVSNDTLDEYDETLDLSLDSSDGADLGSQTTHEYTILDDDAAPTVEFSLASSAGPESTSPAVLTATLSTASGRTVTVDYAVTGGTATGGGTDYTLASGALIFTAGQTSRTISIPIVDDSSDEGNETIEVTLSNAVDATLGANDVHTYTIQDDDQFVSFDLASSSGGEGSTPVLLGVSLSNTSSNTVTVNYAVTGGTATGSGTDYTLASGTLSFAPGETAKTVSLAVVDDSLDEDDETVTVTLSSPSNAQLGATTAHTYTINDDDLPPTVAFDLAASSGGEGVSNVSLAVSLSTASGRSVTVDYAVTGGTATGSGTDYTLASGTLTFTAGQTARNVALTVTEDLMDEGDETIDVTLSNPGNASLGATTAHTYTIVDNDPMPTINFALASLSASESATPGLLEVTLSNASADPVTVDYAVTAGTATSGGTDYTLASGTVTFASGETSKNISIAVNNDALDEDDETIEVTLSNAVSGNLGTQLVHTYTILDDDLPPTVAFTLASSNGEENVTPASLAVALSGASGKTVTVDYAVTGGTATGSGTDYTLAAGTLTFNAGTTSQNVSIAVVNDALFEPSETVIVTLANPTNASLGGTTAHTYTIDDDDDAEINFAASTSSGVESASPVLLNVTLSASTASTVTVDYAVTGGTATGSGTDYTLANGTLTFTPGDTSEDISLAVVNDLLDEADETVVVTLSSPSNATLGATIVHTFTINDNDPAPTVAFALASSNGGESTGTVNLAVNLSAASGRLVTVDYSVTGGTATGGGADYTLANGTLTFVAGDTSENVSISVVNDVLDEDDETVVVTLASPSNATLGATTAHTYTINDDDAAPTVAFDLASSQGDEATTPGLVAVNLSAASGKTVTVDYAVTGGTATGSGTDYTLASGTVTFNAGEITKNISITVANDTTDEDDETVVLGISNPANATLGAQTSHSYLILDNDNAPTVAFTIASSSGGEATTPANLAVSLSAASGKTVTVNYAVTGGTATGSGTDYTLAAGTVTFTAGVTSQNISPVIVNDVLDEDDETIVVELSSPSNATLGAQTSHTFTITDNDASPTVAFSASNSSADEMDGSATIPVTLSAVSGRTVTVTYSVSGGTATGSGTDYTLAAGLLTFAAGVTSQDITVSIVDDRVEEVTGETVVITLGSPTNATLGATNPHTFTILDDPMSPGLAYLRATQTTNSTNLNQSTAYALSWSFSSVDPATFSHSTVTNPSRLTVLSAGDYFVGLSMPVTSTTSRSNPRAEVRVNGTAVGGAVSLSSYIRAAGGHNESSGQFGILLPGLSVNDYIEVFTSVGGRTGTVTANGAVTLMAEKIDSARSIFRATATRTVASTNLNGTASALQWTDTVKDADYTHSNSTNTHQVTLGSSGDYLIHFNAPLYSTTADTNITAKVLLNGSQIPGGAASQGYLDGANGHNESSLAFFGMAYNVSAGSVLTITMEREAATGTVNMLTSNPAHLYIEKVDSSSGFFVARGNQLVSGTDWNPASASAIQWSTQTAIDTSVFSHSTSSNSHQITVNERGDYMLLYNDALTSGTTRTSPTIKVQVDGVNESGAVSSSHYAEITGGHSDTSTAMVFLLKDLKPGNVITVTAQQEAATGTVDDFADALLTIWKK